MKNNFISSKKINSSITFGFFTKAGGYSTKNFNSLNCSYSSGDKKSLVSKNIKLAKRKIGLEKSQLKTINQNHSNKVYVINKNNIKDKLNGDAIITKDPNISIAVLTADCCPIFFYDSDYSFISCVHAGWKGAYLNIIEKTINKIIKIQPNKIKINAIIGPCLNKKSFEVSLGFKSKFLSKEKKYKKFFYHHNKKNKFLFDMRGLIKSQILEKKIENIENIDLDTYSNKALFFSHRRSTHLDNYPTGRMINIIGFNK